MTSLREFIKKCVIEAFDDDKVVTKEVTSSSEKKEGITSDDSLWDAEFDTEANPNANLMNGIKTASSMWDLKFGAGGNKPGKTAGGNVGGKAPEKK